MSGESDRFWVTLFEKVVGLALLIIGAILLYFTWDTSSKIGAYTWIFALLGVVVLVIGLLLMIVRPSD